MKMLHVQGGEIMELYQGKQIAYLYICCGMILAVIATLSGSILGGVAALIMVVSTPVVCASFRRAMSILILSYFILDQVSFSVFGGTFKIYFLFSFLVIALLFRFSSRIFYSRILRMLLFWMLFSIVICATCSTSKSALVTYLGVVLQILSALAIFLFLTSGTFSLEDLERIFVIILSVMIGFGLVQYLLYQLGGVVIGVNLNTAAIQLAVGQISGLRYEGNALGKLIGWGIIFCIPPLVNLEKEERKKYKYLLCLLLIVYILSITRAVLYALAMISPIIALWYLYRRKASKVFKAVFAISVLVGALFLALEFNIFHLEGYSLYKLQNMFLNYEQANADGSAGFRLESIRQGIDIWMSSPKNFLTGVGYLQAQGDLSHRGGLAVVAVGGCELVILAVSFGIIGLVLYLCLMFNVFFRSLKISRNADFGKMHQIWAERMAFSSVFYLALQAVSGCMLCPEYWMMFGIAAYINESSFAALPKKLSYDTSGGV